MQGAKVAELAASLLRSWDSALGSRREASGGQDGSSGLTGQRAGGRGPGGTVAFARAPSSVRSLRSTFWLSVPVSIRVRCAKEYAWMVVCLTFSVLSVSECVGVWLHEGTLILWAWPWHQWTSKLWTIEMQWEQGLVGSSKGKWTSSSFNGFQFWQEKSL